MRASPHLPGPVERELKRIGFGIKTARLRRNMSQQELAVKAHLSMSLVSQIEQGKKTDPRMSTVTALATALGVNVGELTGVASTPKKPRPKRRGK